jgi:hypothetical protein
MIKRIFIAAAILLLAILGIIFFRKKTAVPLNSGANSIENTEKTDPRSQIQNFSLAINGEKVEQSVAAKRPIAVMVENHPDARPQSGLLGADLVYETLAEGGITRFLAVYQTQAAVSIGPIRSARTYFAEIADELGAIYAHVGGNSDALANIKQNLYRHLSDADQFFDDGTYFHRISSRVAPHNVYSSVSKLEGLAAAKKFNNAGNFQLWQFKDNTALYASSAPATDIIIDFSLPQFLVNYKYDSSHNQYLRFMAGKSHTDFDTGKQIAAKDVVVQFVDIFPVKSDTPLSIGMTLTGGGKAYVFEDGNVITGTWQKAAGGRTRYYDSTGKEIEFNPGNIWVEIVPTGRAVTWK